MVENKSIEQPPSPSIQEDKNFKEWLEFESIPSHALHSCTHREKGFLERAHERYLKNKTYTKKQELIIKTLKKKPRPALKKEESGQSTLDPFLRPMKDMTDIKSFDREEGSHPWMVLNGEELYYHTIGGHMCFNLRNIAIFIKYPYDTVQKAFKRITQKSFVEIDEDFFVEGKDYLLKLRSNFITTDMQSVDLKKNTKHENLIFLTYLGMWKLLGSFKKDYPVWVYHKMGERIYNQILTNTYEGGILEFNVGTELHELYKKYKKFLKIFKQIESPIERWFYGWAWDKIEGLEWQYPLDKLTIDFAVPEFKIAIECDGKEYHSSVDQRNRDNKRDAFLHSEGWIVQRFTGNQIYTDVDSCVNLILKIIEMKKKKMEYFF